MGFGLDFCFIFPWCRDFLGKKKEYTYFDILTEI